MLKNLTLFLTVAALSFMSGCSAQPPISGSIRFESTDWRPVVFLLRPQKLTDVAASFLAAVVDSALVQPDGRFEFEHWPVGASDQPELFEVCVQKKGERFDNRLLDADPATANYFPIVLKKGETVRFGAVAERLQTSLSFENSSPENAALEKLRDLRINAFRTELQPLADRPHDEENLLAQEAALGRFRQKMMDFAQKSLHFLPAMAALRWVSPENDFERSPEFLVAQCEKWRAEPHRWAAQLCEMGRADRLAPKIGDEMPDLLLPMVAGDTLALRSLLGRRLTLLDLWASWCAPCRRENREILRPLYADFHEKGLEIVGCSIDASGPAWRAAIQKDGAAWRHASHLAGDADPTLETLRLKTIPANFLLDERGRIVTKNLHGDALRKFLEDYFR